VRGERFEVRVVHRGDFRLPEYCRRGDEAVESRTAAAAGLVEQLGG
jgi:hypothetical protein